MIRILHYVYKMDRGGIETMIMNLYRNIDKDKFQFDFAVHTKDKGHYDDEIRRLGGQIIYFPLLRKSPIKYIYKWNKFWKNNNQKYEAFHFHTPTLANIYPLQRAAKHNVQLRIVHSHNTYAKKGKLQKIHDIIHKYHSRKINKYANKFFACSKPAAKWLFGTNNKIKIQIFKNGIKLDKFFFDQNIRKVYRDKMNLKNKFVVGNIARFAPQKNHNFLIDIFNEVVKINEDSVLLLIGIGELEKNIKNKVKELGLLDKVKFLGIREDISELLMAMDLFLFPSLYEGLGIVLVEAQASGLNVLASDSIPSEVKILKSTNFASLDMEPYKWAKKAFDTYKLNRKNIKDNFKSSGYEIKHTTKLYENYIKEGIKYE